MDTDSRTKNPALQRAIDLAGGQNRLAAGVGTTQSQIWFWLTKSKKGVPAEFCIRIEELTGVPRHELRPDVFPVPQSSEVSSCPAP